MEICLRVGVVSRPRALLAGESPIGSETRTLPRRPHGPRIRWQPASSLGVPSLAASSERVQSTTSRVGRSGGSTWTTTVRGTRPRSLFSLSVGGDRERPRSRSLFRARGGRRVGMRGARGSREDERSSVLPAGAGTSTLAVRTNDRRLAPRRPCDGSCHVVLASASTLATGYGRCLKSLPTRGEMPPAAGWP